MFGTLRDLWEVISIAPRVERDRRRLGPGRLLPQVRRRGLSRRVRTDVERTRLRTVIRQVDRLFPAGPNCYRRALLEIAVDARAAAEPLHMGITLGDRAARGHAWLESSSDRGSGYDVELRV